ncbi:MAG: hypothetical protein IIB83_07775 [Bacteroidetes bacterium]|nr:hypothetical protein [Bacteroidota bacterium]
MPIILLLLLFTSVAVSQKAFLKPKNVIASSDLNLNVEVTSNGFIINNKVIDFYIEYDGVKEAIIDKKTKLNFKTSLTQEGEDIRYNHTFDK